MYNKIKDNCDACEGTSYDNYYKLTWDQFLKISDTTDGWESILYCFHTSNKEEDYLIESIKTNHRDHIWVNYDC